jgi:uncharacterized glyoxalase superfamily protein PhnB
MLHAGHHLRDASALPRGGPVTLTLYVDGLDALHEALGGCGRHPTEIQRMPYGARECYVQDPEGNEIALVEFRASEPPYVLERSDGGDGGEERA